MQPSADLKRKYPSLYRIAPYHTGPVFLNAIGLQLIRAAAKHLARRLRPKRGTDAAAETIVEDGVVVIPDFLDTETFSAVRREYEESRARLPYRRDWDYAEFVPAGHYDDPERLQATSLAIEDSIAIKAENLPLIQKHIVENARIKSIISAASRRAAEKAPDARVVIWKRAAAGDEIRSDKSQVRPRGEYMLHADTHYPTFKAFFYLGPVTERNGAFVYVKKSHRLTWERLKYEYDASLRVAQAKKDGSWFKYPYGHIRRPDPGFIARLGLREEAVCAPANSLVLADTSGFHRRGAFTSDEPRETVFMHWRRVDASVLGL